MEPKKRPACVPAEAIWVEKDELNKEWELVSLVKGKKHGPARSWRKDGTLLLEAHYVNGQGDGPYCRYHQNGERSQFGFLKKDKLWGLCTWVRSTAATTEIPATPHEVVWRTEAEYTHEGQRLPRYFAQDGTELGRDLNPIPTRPAGVASFAVHLRRDNGNVYWEDGQLSTEKIGQRIGCWRVWNEDGHLFEEVDYQKEKNITPYRVFHSNGTLCIEGAYDTSRLKEFPGAGRHGERTPIGHWRFFNDLGKEIAVLDLNEPLWQGVNGFLPRQLHALVRMSLLPKTSISTRASAVHWHKLAFVDEGLATHIPALLEALLSTDSSLATLAGALLLEATTRQEFQLSEACVPIAALLFDFLSPPQAILILHVYGEQLCSGLDWRIDFSFASDHDNAWYAELHGIFVAQREQVLALAAHIDPLVRTGAIRIAVTPQLLGSAQDMAPHLLRLFSAESDLILRAELALSLYASSKVPKGLSTVIEAFTKESLPLVQGALGWAILKMLPSGTPAPSTVTDTVLGLVFSSNSIATNFARLPNIDIDVPVEISVVQLLEETFSTLDERLALLDRTLPILLARMEVETAPHVFAYAEALLVLTAPKNTSDLSSEALRRHRTLALKSLASLPDDFYQQGAFEDVLRFVSIKRNDSPKKEKARLHRLVENGDVFGDWSRPLKNWVMEKVRLFFEHLKNGDTTAAQAEVRLEDRWPNQLRSLWQDLVVPWLEEKGEQADLDDDKSWRDSGWLSLIEMSSHDGWRTPGIVALDDDFFINVKYDCLDTDVSAEFRLVKKKEIWEIRCQSMHVL